MSEKGLMSNSPEGGTFQKSVGATTAVLLHADKQIQSCMLWTDIDGVYFAINETANATSHAKLLPYAWTPLPYENMNQVSLYNSTASAADIHCAYRVR